MVWDDSWLGLAIFLRLPPPIWQSQLSPSPSLLLLLHGHVTCVTCHPVLHRAIVAPMESAFREPSSVPGLSAFSAAVRRFPR